MPSLPPTEKLRRLERARELAAWLRLSDDHARNVRMLYVLTMRIWMMLVFRGRQFSDQSFSPSWWRFPLGLFWILLRPGARGHSPADSAEARVYRWLARVDYLYDEDQYSRYFIYAIIADKIPIPLPDLKGLSPDDRRIAMETWDRDRRDPKFHPPDPPWLPKNNYKKDPRNSSQSEDCADSPSPGAHPNANINPRSNLNALLTRFSQSAPKDFLGEMPTPGSTHDFGNFTSLWQNAWNKWLSSITSLFPEKNQFPDPQPAAEGARPFLFADRDLAWFESRSQNNKNKNPKNKTRPEKSVPSESAPSQNKTLKFGTENLAEYCRYRLGDIIAPIIFPDDWPRVNDGWENKLLPSEKIPALPNEDNLDSHITKQGAAAEIHDLEIAARQRVPKFLELSVRDLPALLPIPHARSP